MKKLLKSHCPRLFAFLRMFRILLLRRDSYLYTSGYYQSMVRGVPSDADGNALPWMNYPFTTFLEARLRSDMRVFEYGSGASTHYFAGRTASVISCEHDHNWYENARSALPGNARVIFRELDKDGSYCRAIADETGSFDVVIVDGRDRVNCVRQAVKHLSDRGVIILDDSHREHYQPVFDWMAGDGFRALTLEGLKPMLRAAHSTSVFYRDGNCLGL